MHCNLHLSPTILQCIATRMPKNAHIYALQLALLRDDFLQRTPTPTLQLPSVCLLEFSFQIPLPRYSWLAQHSNVAQLTARPNHHDHRIGDPPQASREATSLVHACSRLSVKPTYSPQNGRKLIRRVTRHAKRPPFQPGPCDRSNTKSGAFSPPNRYQIKAHPLYPRIRRYPWRSGCCLQKQSKLPTEKTKLLT